MGNFIRVPGVVPATTRPKVVTTDEILPTSGALFLADPMHPRLGQWAAGAPANGASVPNLAATQAASLLGVSAASLTGTMDTVGMTGTKGLVERTAKGGLHAIFSQTQNSTGGDSTHSALILPLALYTWVSTGGAGVGHSYYVSMWGHTSRKGAYSAGQVEAIANLASSTAAGAWILDGGGPGIPKSSAGSPPFVATTSDPAQILPVGKFRKSLAHTGLFAAGTWTNIAAYRTAFNVGNFGNLNTFTGGGAPAPFGVTGSRVLYRFYLEDLTVSGRTYAQVDAIDAALYAADVTTVGGRYYGDTFTDPATIP